jgi:O-antigen ligase
MAFMSSLSLKNNTLISFIISLFLITGVSTEHGMSVTAVMIFIISIAGLIQFKKTENIFLQRQDIFWPIILSLFFLLIAADVLLGYGNLATLDTPSRFLLFIPLYLYIRKVGVNIKMIVIGASIGLVVVGLLAMLAINSGSYYYLGSANHHTVFGQLTILMLAISVLYLNKKNKIYLNLLIVFSVILGFYAVMASGGRGGWIAIPVLVFYVIFSKVYFKKILPKFFAFIVITFLISVSYFSTNLPVKDRVDAAINNAQLYFTEHKVNSSTGARLEMFKAALLMSFENPLTGVGEHEYVKHKADLIKEERIDPFISRYKEPHNQYLNSFAEQGVLGLSSFLLLLIFPLLIFKKSTNLLSSRIGMLISISYLDFAITMPVFEIQMTALFYVIIMSTLLANSIKELND